jgi:hypothetical protein
MSLPPTVESASDADVSSITATDVALPLNLGVTVTDFLPVAAPAATMRSSPSAEAATAAEVAGRGEDHGIAVLASLRSHRYGMFVQAAGCG